MDVKGLMEVVRTAGSGQYPNEACGLVIKKGKKYEVVPCANCSSDPRHTFMINPKDYVEVAKRGEVIGVWHTHIEAPATPSEADRVGCEASGVPWYIFSVRKTETGYTLSEPEVLNPCGFEMPYLGRPYVPGVFDCLSIVRDYYHREFQIEIRDYPRVEPDGRLGQTLFAERYEQEGFVRLIDQPPEAGDVFLIQDDAIVPSHAAVYIGDDMILHHCRGRLSRRDIYGGYWEKFTTHHLRHKSKC